MKAGDRVVCIKTYIRLGVGVYKNEIYTIKALWVCKCGIKRFDVGLKAPPTCKGSICPVCGKTSNDDIAWPRSKFFAPLQYNSAYNTFINKEVIEKETVEEKSDVPIKEPKTV